MQPAAVPLTELLHRLVAILTGLLKALGVEVPEELMAGLLKLGEDRRPESAEFGPCPTLPCARRDGAARPGLADGNPPGEADGDGAAAAGPGERFGTRATRIATAGVAEGGQPSGRERPGTDAAPRCQPIVMPPKGDALRCASASYKWLAEAEKRRVVSRGLLRLYCYDSKNICE
jgi:hypothetical protein